MSKDGGLWVKVMTSGLDTNVNINKNNGSMDFKLVKTRYVELLGNWCRWGLKI